jgi:hypothetical protein
MTNEIIELPRYEVTPSAAAAPAAPALPAIALAPVPPAVVRWEPPVLGCLAAIFGIAALFKATLILAPLGLGFAAAAVFARQFSWAAVGGIASLVALLISPLFWTILGLAWLIERLSRLWGWIT